MAKWLNSRQVKTPSDRIDPMLTIRATSIVSAWQQSCLHLVSQGRSAPDRDYYREDAAAIEVASLQGQRLDARFPMSSTEIENICDYLTSGSGEDKVSHEWTKMYRERLFSQPSQIEAVCRYLQSKRHGVRAQATVWRTDDMRETLAPCLQTLWFRIVDARLELHVHMRTSDCYGKLLMNINEFAAVQEHVAREIEAKNGRLLFFIDSLHFHNRDRHSVLTLTNALSPNQVSF